ncbi:MAG: serine/threonine-protein kinase [Planctomycetota bacterium]
MSPPPALLQALAPRFHWIAPLGEGTFGWVGLVEERALGRRAALKLGKQAGNPTQLARFEREAQIAAGLQHPHTVSVHSAGVVHGHPFLVLDYVEGARTLREVERTTGVLERLAQLRDVARGMAQAHAQGIVHRDLKPDNVLVDPEGVARVTDFGCATGQDVDRLTLSGAAVGTPLYMAPEQLAGERDRVGPPSDVWSLGVMLHEVACGRLPFVADSWTALAGQALSG